MPLLVFFTNKPNPLAHTEFNVTLKYTVVEKNSAQQSLHIAQYGRSEVYTHASIGEDEDTNKGVGVVLSE